MASDAKGVPEVYNAQDGDTEDSHSSDMDSEPDGRSPLHQAVADHDVAVISKLLGEGASVVAQDNLGNTPLHVAAASAYYCNIVKMLLESANGPVAARIQNEAGQTPLHIAAAAELPYLNEDWQTKTVNYLLKAGSRTDVKDANGKTPQDVAVDSMKLVFATRAKQDSRRQQQKARAAAGTSSAAAAAAAAGVGPGSAANMVDLTKLTGVFEKAHELLRKLQEQQVPYAQLSRAEAALQAAAAALQSEQVGRERKTFWMASKGAAIVRQSEYMAANSHNDEPLWQQDVIALLQGCGDV